jgi:hypothetical protein
MIFSKIIEEEMFTYRPIQVFNKTNDFLQISETTFNPSRLPTFTINSQKKCSPLLESLIKYTISQHCYGKLT